MTHARAGAPDHVYDAKVSDRIDGKRPRWPRPARSRVVSHILADLGEDVLSWA